MVLKKIINMLGASGYLSDDLVKKGLSKISPKMGKFFRFAEREGHTIGAALSFLNQRFSEDDAVAEENERPDETANRQSEIQRRAGTNFAKNVGQAAIKAIPAGIAGSLLGKGASAIHSAISSIAETQSNQKEPQKSEQTQQEKEIPKTAFANFMNQHPDLGKYLDDLMEKGYDPVSAAKEAKGRAKFRDIIENIEDSVGQSLENLMKYLFEGTDKFQGTKSKGNQGSRGEQLRAMIQALRNKKNR